MQEIPQAPIIQNVCFVAGHSGGHIVPCITLAQQLQQEDPSRSFLFFTTSGKLDVHIIKPHTFITHHTLTIEKIPYKKPWRWPIFIWKMTSAFFKSLWILKKEKPDIIKTTGGITSFPVCLAGKILGIPIDLYELNVQPGMAIKALAPIASNIFIIHQKTEGLIKKSCKLTPYPVRYTKEEMNLSKEDARSMLGLEKDRYTLFILGGSQGSLLFNEVAKKYIEQNTGKFPIQIIHQTGESSLKEIQDFYQNQQIPALVFTYKNNLALYYQSADLVLSRAGAGALAEVAIFQKNAIIVPIIISNSNHQLYNAQAYSERFPEYITLEQEQDAIAISTAMMKQMEEQLCHKSGIYF